MRFCLFLVLTPVIIIGVLNYFATEKEIYNYTSLRKTKDGLVIEWDGSMISKTNLLKMDLLGIKCLTIIKDTLRMLEIVRNLIS